MNGLKASVREFWDRAACGEVYAEGTTIAEQLSAQAEARYRIEPYIESFAGFDGASLDVLEIGVGMGADHARWAASAPARLVGVDLTARAVELTAERMRLLGLRSELLTADAECLPFAEATFDLVYSWGVLHHTPDTRVALQEVHRVLRPGGEARIMLYHRPSIVGLMLWTKYGAGSGHPFQSLRTLYSEHLESPGTKGYTVSEGRALVRDFTSARVRSQVSHGDLLVGTVGERHASGAISVAKRLWPRGVIRHVHPLGLFLLITATK